MIGQNHTSIRLNQSDTIRTMREVKLAGSVSVLLLLSACVTSEAARGVGASFAESLTPDPEIVTSREDAVQSDNGLRLLRIAKFERQAMSLYYEEPLRLGPLSSAMIPVLPSNLVGQLAAQRFYSFVDSEQAIHHRNQAERIALAMSWGRKGTWESPFRAHSVAEARAYVIRDGSKPIGSIYATSEEFPIVARISALREGEGVEYQYFEVLPVLNAAELFRQQADPQQGTRGTRQNVLNTLARLGDVTARVTIGQLLVEDGQLSRALQVLDAENASDNLLVDLLMARVNRALAQTSEGEEKADRNLQAAYHYRQAAASGYDSAMFELALLNLSGTRGEDTRHDGIDILERAAEAGNRNAMFHLALHLTGGAVWQPDARRGETLLAAVLHEPPTAEQKRVVSELLLPNSHDGGEADKSVDYFSRSERTQLVQEIALDWVRETAKSDPEAMVMLARLFARGSHVRQNFRKSGALFRKAASRDPDNSDLVNDIAWTLAVTYHGKLRNPRFALRIMDTMMSKDADAGSEPAFIDTLAAIYAALGDFETAITLQRKAIDYASAADFPEAMRRELAEHMDAFTKRQTVIDPVP